MTKSPDLLLIHPGAQHGIYGALGDDLTALEPPTWTRMIGGFIQDRGFSIEIIDAEAERISPERVAAWVEAMRPRLVCIVVYGHMPSASTQQMIGASAIATAIKRRVLHYVPVIMVGAHVSALPEQTLREEAIDFACVGEGPVTIEALLRGDLSGWSTNGFDKVPGLVWRRKGKTVINPSAPLIEDMSQLHGDVWNLLPMNLYRSHGWQCFGDLSKRQPYASIYSTLGCPYKCSFCMINAPFQTNRYRRFSPGSVVAQIVKLHEQYGVSTVKIADEMFILSENHYLAICDGLIASGIADKLNIWAYARVDSVKPHTLDKLRRAGFRWLALGIESGSKYVRDGAQKRLKNDDIVGVVRAIQAADINVIGNFIFGLPDDTVESMQETLDLAMTLNCEFVNMYVTMAYPGSPLYAEAVAKGWTLPETWRGFSQHNDDCRPLDTLHVPAATVLRFRDEAFNTYFTSPSYLDMVERKFGRETLEHVRAMTGYKLRRKLLEQAEAAE